MSHITSEGRCSNCDEPLREFESQANKLAIERQHEMEKARAELLKVTESRECWKNVAESRQREIYKWLDELAAVKKQLAEARADCDTLKNVLKSDEEIIRNWERRHREILDDAIRSAQERDEARAALENEHQIRGYFGPPSDKDDKMIKSPSFREFESAANRTAIARQREMEAAREECLRLTIELLSARECLERIGAMDKPHPLSEGWPAQVAREWLANHPK